MSCPICRKPTQAAWRPFCSARCADIDLGRWVSGDYAIPSRDPEDIEKAAEAAIEAEERDRGKPH